MEILEPSLFCTFRFEKSFFVIALDISCVFSNVDSFTLDRYVDGYYLSDVYVVLLPSPSTSILKPLASKVGFYLRHLVCGLRLPPNSFFLEVLCLYGIHLIQLCHNVVSEFIVFEVFCVSYHIPLNVLLFWYFYRLKMYGDWET